jgi:hypothetical protein
VEFPTIKDFKEYLDDYTIRYARYEYVNPFYNKRKKANPFKSVYLKIGGRYHLFNIYEHTQVYALKELAQFLGDYLDELYPEIKAPFRFETKNGKKYLIPQSLKKISDLYIVWVGKAIDPDKGIY